MGFLSNTTNFTLTAKLTPEGRRRLVTNNNNLITHFSLGDSDAYYGAYTGLTGGEVPGIGGDDNTLNNGGVNYILRSTLGVNPRTDKKPVSAKSVNVTTSVINSGYKTIKYSGGSITQDIVSLDDISTDSLTNLFYSFALPILDSEFKTYTGATDSEGGLSNTAYSGLAQDKILIVGIDNSEYGELIDGKSIKLELQGTGSTYDIYGTYEQSTRSNRLKDSDVADNSANVARFGPNRALLFSDDIQKPNGGDATKSWSTGYAQNKPFSLARKEQYNFKTNVNLSRVVDKPVGIAYLDKGFLVITDQTIVNDFVIGSSGSTATTITYNHARTSVSQSVNCIADRGEFTTSTNNTWSSGDTPRITEVALFDDGGALIAIGKLNKAYEKTKEDFVAFNVTIEY